MFIFILYCLASVYILVIDTSFVSEFSLFENEYFSMSVCFSVVIVGFLLLVVASWHKYRYKMKAFSLTEKAQLQQFTFSRAIKYLSLHTVVSLLKSACYTVCLLPSAIVTAFAFLLAEKGIYMSLLAVLVICDVVLFFNGLFNSLCFVQKFALTDYCFSVFENGSVIGIIKKSSYLTDGKLIESAKIKIKMLLFKIIGLIFPVCSVIVTVSEFIFLTNKIIPHTVRKKHAEKSVVFYLGKASAG